MSYLFKIGMSIFWVSALMVASGMLARAASSAEKNPSPVIFFMESIGGIGILGLFISLFLLCVDSLIKVGK